MFLDPANSIALIWLLLLVPARLPAADDPFWGDWKLNREKTLIGDRLLIVEDLGNKRFKITLRRASYTITADGREQQVHVPGDSLTLSTDFAESILQMGGNKWKFVMKQDGRVAESTWTVTEDGKTLNIEGKTFPTDQSSQEVMHRIGSGSGLAGVWATWKSGTNASVPTQIEIAAYGDTGLSFVFPFGKVIQRLKFDNKEYPQEGVNADKVATWSAERIDAHTVHITSKANRPPNFTDDIRAVVAPDGNTLTLKVRYGHGQAPSEIVYDRQSSAGVPRTIVSGATNSIALERNGDLLFTNRDCVQKIAARTHTLSMVTCGLRSPTWVTAGKHGDVFIADTYNNRVLKVTPNGVQTTIGHGLTRPSSIAVDSTGNVFVTELDRRDVVKISADGAQSTLRPEGEYPVMSIALNASGNLLIADVGYDRVLQMATTGKGQTTVPAAGLNQPSAVVSDSKGNIFILDTGNERVVEVTREGRQRTVINGLKHPSAIAVDEAGRVFVADGSGLLEVPVNAQAHQ